MIGYRAPGMSSSTWVSWRPYAPLEVLRDCRRRFGQRGNLRGRLREGGMRPHVAGDRAELIDHLECPRRVVDRRADLAAVPNDAGVGEQPVDVALVERGDDRWVEPSEAGAKVLPFAQDGQPREPGL